MYADPSFIALALSFRENDLNTKKFTPPPTTTPPPEKQYICLASASQARQKKVTNGLIQHITVDESTSMQWVNADASNRPRNPCIMDY